MRPITVVATLSLVLAASVSVPAAVLASGSSREPTIGLAPAAFEVTRAVKCHILEIQPTGAVVVQDDRSRKVHRLPIAEDTRIFAAKKADFDGRKKLEKSDLVAGQAIKVTIREADMEILRIKVLEG